MKAKKAKSKSRLKKRVSGSACDLAVAAGLIGCARGLPRDLSTNKRYFAGFGKSK
jgi:hypothetical protein